MKATLKHKTTCDTYYYQIIINEVPYTVTIHYVDGEFDRVGIDDSSLSLSEKQIFQRYRLIADLIDELDLEYKAAAYVTTASAITIDEPEFSYFANKVKFLEEV